VDGGLIGLLTLRTTNEVPPARRVEFWRDEVLRFIEPDPTLLRAEPFQAEIRRVQGRKAEIVELVSDSMTANRNAARCRRDGCDDISLEFMVAGASNNVRDNSEHRIRAGDFSIIDCAKPITMVRSRHRNISLMVRRSVVRDRTRELSSLGSHAFANSALTALFKSHIRTTMIHADRLTPDQRAMAIDVALDLAVAVIQAENFGPLDLERLSDGFRHAAKSVIARDCIDPELTPLRIAETLGCSRAALYRAFAGNEESVAQSIWSSRVQHAEHMLNAPCYSRLSITEIAFRSGFLDHSTFNRMFKRRYDMTAEDMRRAFQNA
jgi:AraC family transcriptional regulator, positive regulator of tynA and feaB